MLHITPLIASGICTAGLAAYILFRRGGKSEARILAVLMLAVAVWSSAYALELVNTELAAKLFWAKFKYVGQVVVAPAWLAFAFEYSGKGKWLTRRRLILLAVISACALLLVWSNDIHHLYWTDASVYENGALSTLSLPGGIGFWFWMAYSYTLFLLGTFSILDVVIRSHQPYRTQAGIMLVGAVAPWIGNIMFLSDFNPIPHLDLTPFAFAITCFVCALCLFRFRLLDIVPVAHDAIVEGMSDAVVVLDAENSILDMNPSAEDLIGCRASEAIGHPINRIWDFWSDEFVSASEKGKGSLEITLGKKQNERVYSLRTSLRFDSRGHLACNVLVLSDITERKQVENALISEKEFSERLIESSVDGILAFDHDCFYTVWNPGMELISGVGKEKTVGKCAFEVFPFLKESGEDRNFIDALSGKTVTAKDRPYRVPETGRQGFFDARYSPIFDKSGDVIGGLGVIRDVTERKRAEQAIIQAKEAWERTFNAVPDLIAILDNKHRIVRVNNAMAEKMGISPDDAIGLKCCEQIHGTAEPPAFCPHAKLLADGTEHTAEVCEERLGGDFLVTTSPLHDVDGNLIGSVHVARDISIRKQAEEALRESEEKYRNVVENVNVGILVAQDGKLAFANSTVSRVLGYTKDELLSNPDPFSYIHPDDQAMVFERHLRRIAGEDVPPLYPFRIVTKDGTVRWVDSSGVRINWKNKPGTLNFLTDITERMRAEEDRKKLEERLQEAQRMEAVGTLAGGVAHEFNNALVGVTGYIQLLQMELPAGEKIDRYLKRMTESTQRMVRLTNQLLAYARGGKYQTRLITMNNLVEDTISFIRHRINAEIKLETDLSADLLNVEGDMAQLQMALTAILNNAGEAIEAQGGIRVTSRNEMITEDFSELHPGVKPGPHICLSIADNGKGMTEDTRERVFDPFFTTKFQGRGLGMAAAFGIVKNHSGAIVVDSELGKGTEVRIYLPAVEEEIPTTDQATPPISTGSGTILVIDDEQTVVEVSRLMLEEMGYQVLSAGTGREAIDIVKSYNGDIALSLLDIKLTDMEGAEIFQAIKDIRPEMKVLVCSGYSLEGPAQEIIDAGAHGFIQKPFTLEALSAKLDETFQSR